MNKQINKNDQKNLFSSYSILWHRLLRRTLVLSVFMAALSMQSFAQTETFDILTYTPPKNWKKELKDGAINYTNINESKGIFCVTTIYPSYAGSNDAQTDFTNAWNELVVTPYAAAAANPKTEIQTTESGWKAVVGSAPVKMNGTDVYIILTVFSGFGKTLSVRAALNDQSYTTQIDALLETMKFEKTTSSPSSVNTLSTIANNAIGKFGLMSYASPSGWSEQKFADGVVFKPINLPTSEHLAMQIMEPMTGVGSLEEALTKSFAEATTMYNGTPMYQSDGKYSRNPIIKSFNGWEYIRGKGGIKVNDGSQFGTEYGLELFVIKINNRFERVAIFESRSNCKTVTNRFYASDRINYRNDVEQLLFSLQFSDYNATTLKSGSANGSGVVGVWQGTTQAGGTGVKLDVFSLILFNNGQVYYGPHFPSEGLSEINTRIKAELNKRDWKTYTNNNGSGILKMIYADITFRMQGNNLILTKNQMDWTFFKMPSVDGAKLNGTYVMSAVNGKIPSITFSADGRFNDNGALKVLYHEYVDCLNPAVVNGTGTYQIKDYTIYFNYNDGRKIKIAFTGTGYSKNNPSPAAIRMSYNEDPLTRQ